MEERLRGGEREREGNGVAQGQGDHSLRLSRRLHKSYCPFCVSVKKLLTDVGTSFKAIELDQESDGSEIQAALAELTGQKSVPNVFVGGKHIGGCDATTAMHKSGKLMPLLSDAGAVAKSSSV